MPSQPACFHRLEEIFTLLWGFDTGYLDRLAVGRLFGVRQRRACVVEYHDCSRHAIDASVACATAVTIGLSLAASYRPRYFFTRCRMSRQMWRSRRKLADRPPHGVLVERAQARSALTVGKQDRTRRRLV